jgi:hypothetical protein
MLWRNRRIAPLLVEPQSSSYASTAPGFANDGSPGRGSPERAQYMHALQTYFGSRRVIRSDFARFALAKSAKQKATEVEQVAMRLLRWTRGKEDNLYGIPHRLCHRISRHALCRGHRRMFETDGMVRKKGGELK